jgi:hypothetical protein
MRSAPDGVCIELLISVRDNQSRAIAASLISVRVAPHTAMPRSAKTAIYPPPRSGFPYVAVIFSRDGAAVQARHPSASKEEAEAFLQAFTQGMRAAVPVSETTGKGAQASLFTAVRCLPLPIRDHSHSRSNR